MAAPAIISVSSTGLEQTLLKTRKFVSIGGPVSVPVFLALSCTANRLILRAPPPPPPPPPPLTDRVLPNASLMIPDSRVRLNDEARTSKIIIIIVGGEWELIIRWLEKQRKYVIIGCKGTVLSETSVGFYIHGV